MDKKEMVYEGSKPFAFVSYSHADQAKVEHFLRILYPQGIRFWYDYGIPIGNKWETTINSIFDKSRCFLAFLTNGIEQRYEVVRELKMAMNRNKADPSYRIIIIMLERMPLSYLFKDEPELLELFAAVQYIPLFKFGGVTMDFCSQLLSHSVWGEEFVDNEIRRIYGKKPWNETEQLDIVLDSYDDIISDSDYIYPRACPEKTESDGLEFYKVKPGETDPNAVYPICIDNQWCPAEFLSNPDFLEKGFEAEGVLSERKRHQQSAVYAALLHNWQMLINRASVFNTRAFIDWYTDGGENQQAFCRLLDNGSFVIYLYNEDAPIDPPKFDHDEEAFKVWKELCREHKVFCIKFDWNSPSNNTYEITRTVAGKMRELFLTTADDKYRLDILRDATDIPKEKAEEFRNIWQKIRKSAVSFYSEQFKDYTRNWLYKDYIVKANSKVDNCLIDTQKPFSRELKQIVDFVYTINLPTALHIRPMMTHSDQMWNFAFSERRTGENFRTLMTDEIVCSILNFSPVFLRHSVYMPQNPDITLSQVADIRENDLYWKQYLEAVTAGRKRANLNEIDFNDMAVVWERHRKWMNELKNTLPDMNWTEKEGSLSMIYHFGDEVLIVVYKGDKEILIKHIPSTTSANTARENTAIDYVCGNILEYDISNNCFYTEIRLFEGLIEETGAETCRKVMESLKKLPHRIV